MLNNIHMVRFLIQRKLDKSNLNKYNTSSKAAIEKHWFFVSWHYSCNCSYKWDGKSDLWSICLTKTLHTRLSPVLRFIYIIMPFVINRKVFSIYITAETKKYFCECNCTVCCTFSFYKLPTYAYKFTTRKANCEKAF